MEQLVDYFLLSLGIYLALGILFGLYFILHGAQQLDSSVEGTPWHFRLIIFPGSVLLWAVLLWKLKNKKHDKGA